MKKIIVVFAFAFLLTGCVYFEGGKMAADEISKYGLWEEMFWGMWHFLKWFLLGGLVLGAIASIGQSSSKKK